MIAIIDYDIGNLGAVANMLHRIGVPAVITHDPAQIKEATKIILPGNGAFDPCMQGLRATGLIPILEQRVLRERVPLLGICVGAQMLGCGSEEGDEPGLGWLDMQVKRFPLLPGLRVPHMGWNEIKPALRDHPFLEDLPTDPRFYFVHSYFMVSNDSTDVLMTAHHGIDFVAALARGNIVGVQFHPEKSHRFGRQLLSQFAKAA